jgi:hypothetical protein
VTPQRLTEQQRAVLKVLRERDRAMTTVEIAREPMTFRTSWRADPSRRYLTTDQAGGTMYRLVSRSLLERRRSLNPRGPWRYEITAEGREALKQ